MNELNELEKWLLTAIKDNESLYEHAVKANDNRSISCCVCRIFTYKRVLHKIHTIQYAQERNEK